jgi:hypothetical protein
MMMIVQTGGSSEKSVEQASGELTTAWGYDWKLCEPFSKQSGQKNLQTKKRVWRVSYLSEKRLVIASTNAPFWGPSFGPSRLFSSDGSSQLVDLRSTAVPNSPISQRRGMLCEKA